MIQQFMTEENFFKRSTIPPLPPGKEIKEAPIPEKIGPYHIEALLDKGGMSILYLGTHPETQETITIKVLSPRFLSHDEMTMRFLNEAEIIAMADHPNIVKLFGYGEWEGGLYIAMEFIQGVSLRQYLLQNPLSVKRALEIVLEVAYALCHLHTHGVIHRDLKPENILINEEDHVKVIDFGIAQLIDPEVKEEATKRQLMGTPIYMSPEQRENPENVSYPSDIYSLGIIAYELVLGKLSHGKIHLSLMPKGLHKILTKALQTEISERYQDIVDFIADLSSYLHSSNFERERKPIDQMGETFEKLKDAQYKITAKEPPNWDFCEIGLAQHRPSGLSSIYCDFFKFSEGIYSLILAESSEGGAEGLMFISYLKGFLIGLIEQKLKPEEIASKINDHLIDEKLNQTFTYCQLLLDPHNNLLHFISCGDGPLWLIHKEETTPEILLTSNIALGLEKKISFNSLSHCWYEGDTLILCPLSSIEEIFTKDQFENVLLESNRQPPQKQVEAIVRKAKNNHPKYLEEHSATVISLLRKQ